MINITVTSIYTPLPFSVYYDRLSICIPYAMGIFMIKIEMNENYTVKRKCSGLMFRGVLGGQFIKQEHLHINTNILNTDKNDKSFNNYATNNNETTANYSLTAEKG